MSPRAPVAVLVLVGLGVVGATLFAAAPARAAFGFQPGDQGFHVAIVEADGTAASQAASHPYEMKVDVNLESAPGSGGSRSDGDLRDLELELPAGLIENPSALIRCSRVDFATARTSPFEASQSGENCPASSQIGVVAMRTSFGGGSISRFGVFNLTAPPGAPSQFGFAPFGNPVTLTPHYRDQDGAYGETLDLHNLQQHVDVLGFELTIWGAPWNLTHDEERGNCLNEVDSGDPFGKCSTGRPRNNPPQAYLTLPSTCGAPLAFTARASAWQREGAATAFAESSDEAGDAFGLEGCDALGPSFAESASALLTGSEATSPSGLNFVLTLAPEGLTQPTELAPSQARTATMTLPEGVTINPSLGAGLESCTEAQYASETPSTPAGAGCPNGSKIGSVSVQSPLFEGPLGGSLYLAQPYRNPHSSLVGLYIVVKSAEHGVAIKVPGFVSADARTGGLVASFEDLPQLPYSKFEVQFREGRRAPLVTPATCGTYFTQTELVPWVGQQAARSDGSRFEISSRCPAAATPFNPGGKGGSTNYNAGSYSPFYLHLSRGDAEAEITSYSAVLPPGLLGSISGVPFCPDAAIEAAKTRSGVEEERQPSCPAASAIGHTYTGFGVGGVLAYAPGGLYLAGPYHGAPLSIVAIDAATVGPFDLGVIVVRSAIDIDPSTARVSIDSSGSDPIPHIRDGIPLHLRDIRVSVDRPGFTVNPTSCEPFAVVSTLTGSIAPFADPRGSSALVTTPYQTRFCSSLPFEPKISLKLSGGTRRGEFPALRVVVDSRPGNANIASAVVTLPPSEFLEQSHLEAICSKQKIEREACPSSSVYGRASALTPLLETPLSGQVYMGGGYGHELPDLVAVLHGRGIRIVLDGRIDAYHGGLRATFEGLPDAPLTRFTMNLKGGRRGLLVNSADTCAGRHSAQARFVGQNNATERTAPRVKADCSHKHSHGRRGGNA